MDDMIGTLLASRQKVLEDATRVITHLMRGARRLGLRLSTKTVASFNQKGMAEELLSLLPEDCKVSVNQTAKNLGLGTASGVKRTMNVQKSRLTKMAKRLHRTKGLVQPTKACRPMVWVACKSQGTWGHQGQGMGPTMLTTLRQQFAKAAMLRKSGGCTTNAYGLTVGHGKDPTIAIRIELITAWCDVTITDAVTDEALRKTWHTLLDRLKSSPKIWNAVAGPTAAVIATMLDL